MPYRATQTHQEYSSFNPPTKRYAFFSAGTRQFQTICVLSLKGGQEKFFIIFVSELHGNYCERPSVNDRELVGAEKSTCHLPASEAENLLFITKMESREGN